MRRQLLYGRRRPVTTPGPAAPEEAGHVSMYLDGQWHLLTPRQRPTATDPSLAPAGCDTFYALAPVPHLDSGTDWRTQAEPMRRAIEQRLSDTVLPGLRAEVSTSLMMTPQDFHDRLWSYKGAGFGLEPLLLQSAWFRPHNRSEDLPGLYMVGAGTHPGAGVPGVLMSAKALEKVVPHA